METASMDVVMSGGIDTRLFDDFDLDGVSIIWVTTGERIQDVPVSTLALSIWARTAVYNNKKTFTQKNSDVMVSDLIGIPYKTFFYMKQTSKRSVEEIVEKTGEYLLKSLSPDTKEIAYSQVWNQIKQFETTLWNYELNKEGETPSQEVKTIVPFCMFDKGTIINKNTNSSFQDAPIEVLNLNIRVESVLLRSGIVTIGSLIGMSFSELMRIGHIGSNNAYRIRTKLIRYISNESKRGKSSGSGKIDRNANDLNGRDSRPRCDEQIIEEQIDYSGSFLAPEYYVVENMIIDRNTGKKQPDRPILKINLGVRAVNCLLSNGYTTISQLVGMPISQLFQLRNLGAKTASEIKQKLEQYLAAHLDSSNNESLDTEDESVNLSSASDFLDSGVDETMTSSPIDKTDDKHCLIDGFHVDQTAIINDLTGGYVEDAPIDVLGLSTRAYNSLYRHRQSDSKANHRLVMISDVMNSSFEELSHITNIGTKTVEEIIQKVSDYLFAIVHTETNTSICNDNMVASDYSVQNHYIVNLRTGMMVPDIGIEQLNLSQRAKNALFRDEKQNLSDLISMSRLQINHLQNVGVETASEIASFIPNYLKAHEVDYLPQTIDEKDESTNVHPEITDSDIQVLASDYVVEKGVIYNRMTGKAVRNAPIESLSLSVRATNCLKRSGYSSISGLIGLPYSKFFQIRNLGLKTANEILEQLEEYLKYPQDDIEAVSEAEFEPKVATPSLTITLPEVDPKNPPIIPDYALFNGKIYSRQSMRVISDEPIRVLGLDIFTMKCLIQNGYVTISSLLGLTNQELHRIPHLLTPSEKEIVEKLKSYLKMCHEKILDQELLVKAVDPSEILWCFIGKGYVYITLDEILETLNNYSEIKVREAIDQLVETGKLIYEEESYHLPYKSFSEVLQSEELLKELPEKTIRIIRLRAAGETFQSIGQSEGVTRERIRQIERKGLNKLTKNGHLVFEEDKYAYVFSTYLLDKDFFFDFLGLSSITWYYLNTKHRRGTKDPASAIDDKALSPEIRYSLQKYIHRSDVLIDGVYFPARKKEIIDYVLEKYCREEMGVDTFFAIYNQVLVDNDLKDSNLQISEESKASWVNRLQDSMRLLWKQNQRLRLYDIEGTDFTDLFETINLAQYHNIELSTRKFLLDYPEIMTRYDLRDEYEIHNLLKKLHAEKQNPELEFGRMPGIKFGVFDRDKAVKEILFATAPISQDDLVEAIAKEFGINTESIRFNWLSGISEYYHQGMYSIDYEEMPEKQFNKLKGVLTEDFYYFSELRTIYSNIFPHADISLLSTYNLKKMGFLIYGKYVIQHFPSAEAYFVNLLTAKDIIDINPIRKKHYENTPLLGILSYLKHEMTIIEFEPYQYINVRRLEKFGFGREQLKRYGDRVWSFLVNEEFFTYQSLKRAGFTDELDTLGFGELFYSSILKEDDRFSWQRVGGAIVLNPKGEPFNVRDFLIYRIAKEKSIDIDDFSHSLAEVYGVSLDRQTILTKVKGSNVYYDSIMERIYKDYSTYFEEI